MRDKQLSIEINQGPKCPACQCDTFDDWHHEKTFRKVSWFWSGRLKCHQCGRFFSIAAYPDGQVHSTMWRKAA